MRGRLNTMLQVVEDVTLRIFSDLALVFFVISLVSFCLQICWTDDASLTRNGFPSKANRDVIRLRHPCGVLILKSFTVLSIWLFCFLLRWSFLLSEYLLLEKVKFSKQRACKIPSLTHSSHSSHSTSHSTSSFPDGGKMICYFILSRLDVWSNVAIRRFPTVLPDQWRIVALAVPLELFSLLSFDENRAGLYCCLNAWPSEGLSIGPASYLKISSEVFFKAEWFIFVKISDTYWCHCCIIACT